MLWAWVGSVERCRPLPQIFMHQMRHLVSSLLASWYMEEIFGDTAWMVRNGGEGTVGVEHRNKKRDSV